METRASYLLVGTFVLTFVAGLVVFVIWLAKFQFDTEFARFDIYFKGSVTGLSQAAPVRYSGVRIGEVIDISLLPDRPDEVRVTIETDSKTPVRADTVATLELEGLTGGLAILLIGKAPDAPPLEAGPGQRYPVIASEASTLQQVIQGAPELVQKVDLLLARANDLLNAENRVSLSNSLANIDVFTATLKDHSGEIGALIVDAGATMENVRKATANLEVLAGNLNKDADQLVTRVDTTLASIDGMATGITQSVEDTTVDARALIGDLRGTAQSLRKTSDEVHAMIAENREPLSDFTATGLTEFTGLLIEMRDLVVALNRVTTELQRDPARFLFGDRQQGYEVRQ
jgi:phospholipid/cholesterol/gamma-HCH transport system substrate-binding protein